MLIQSESCRFGGKIRLIGCKVHAIISIFADIFVDVMFYLLLLFIRL